MNKGQKGAESTSALALVRVPFEGTEIEAGLNGDDGAVIRVSVRRVCEALGLAVQSQLAKLREKAWACITMNVTQAPGDPQRREVAMVDVDTLAMWLATIEPTRVKESARPVLIAYQKRAARVLREHFFPQLGPSPATPTPPAFHGREPPEPPELLAAIELLGGIDPRVRSALRKLPPPKKPSVEHWLDQARDMTRLVEVAEPDLPRDPLTCARVARALISGVATAPDHPLVLGRAEQLGQTVALIDRLLGRASQDPEIRQTSGDLVTRWAEEKARLSTR